MNLQTFLETREHVTLVPATARLTYEQDLGRTEPRRHDGSRDACTELVHIGIRQLLGDISLADALKKYNPTNDADVTLLLVRLLTGGDS